MLNNPFPFACLIWLDLIAGDDINTGLYDDCRSFLLLSTFSLSSFIFYHLYH